jgi:hypothetical protein
MKYLLECQEKREPYLESLKSIYLLQPNQSYFLLIFDSEFSTPANRRCNRKVIRKAIGYSRCNLIFPPTLWISPVPSNYLQKSITLNAHV